MDDVEVHVGTEFSVENCNGSYIVKLPDEAALHARSVLRSCINKCQDSDSSFSQSLKAHICFECAELITCLAQIYAYEYSQQPPASNFYAWDKYYESIEESSKALMHKVDYISKTISHDFSPDGVASVKHAIRDAITLTCTVFAQLGETDLEPYIKACMIERGQRLENDEHNC